ncbi:MAG: mannose-6-phosphate isomerase [Bacteroidia bacterium]|nr:mannose-6-phosphate isomerase [Bacteroidia bacterium]
MSETLYPLKFAPIFKDRIWGGSKLESVLNKPLESNQVGESWEISAVEGDISIVSNGPLKGTSLKSLLETYQSDLIGKKNYALFQNQFPLLIKFIDAKEDLSIQLHPNDDLAKKRHNSFGKTEMWHVMQADDDANLIVGFKEKISAEIYTKHLNEKSLPEILNYESVKAGDTYFIEVGRVHAIGAGILLAEIQQTSDVTYRVYDWDRVDADGNARELHNDLALDAINFEMKANFKVDYEKKTNFSNLMVECPFFTTNYLPLSSKLNKINATDSFLIYICIDGELKVETDHYSVQLKKGETVLIPAAIRAFRLYAENAKLLEIYV